MCCAASGNALTNANGKYSNFNVKCVNKQLKLHYARGEQQVLLSFPIYVLYAMLYPYPTRACCTSTF